MNIKGNEGPTFEEITVIEKATNGKIGKYEWWDVRGIDEVFKSNIKPKNDSDIIYHGVLENSFMSPNGKYIGDFDRAKWYQKNKLKVYEPYASGVAEAYNENDELEGYCGYTHRGAQTFRIGDRLFDKSYELKEEDYTPEQWGGWIHEYNDGIAEAEANGDTWWAEDIKKDGISRYVSFKLRGSKVCETFEECAKAAINLSKHLS
jgi:hypothetical protein